MIEYSMSAFWPLSWTFSVNFGDVLTIGSFIFAWSQWKKAESAQESESRLRKSLFRQRSAEHFNEISRSANALSAHVRVQEWSRVAELATRLGAMLSGAPSFCKPLMSESENESLNLAADSLRYVLENMPIEDAQQLPGEKVREMMQRCIVVVYAVEKVAGRMRYLGEWQDDSEEKTVQIDSEALKLLLDDTELKEGAGNVN